MNKKLPILIALGMIGIAACGSPARETEMNNAYTTKTAEWEMLETFESKVTSDHMTIQSESLTIQSKSMTIQSKLSATPAATASQTFTPTETPDYNATNNASFETQIAELESQIATNEALATELYNNNHKYDSEKQRYDQLVLNYQKLGVDYTKVLPWETLLSFGTQANMEPWQTDGVIEFEAGIPQKDRESFMRLAGAILSPEVLDASVRWVKTETQWGGSRTGEGVTIGFTFDFGFYRYGVWHELEHAVSDYHLGFADLNTILRMEELIFDLMKHLDEEYGSVWVIIDKYYGNLGDGTVQNFFYDMGKQIANEIMLDPDVNSSLAGNPIHDAVSAKYNEFASDGFSDHDNIKLGSFFASVYMDALEQPGYSFDDLPGPYLEIYTEGFYRAEDEANTTLAGIMLRQEGFAIVQDPVILKIFENYYAALGMPVDIMEINNTVRYDFQSLPIELGIADLQ